MAILEIELQPAEQTRLEQEAQREGLSVQDWVRQRLAGDKAAPPSVQAGQAVGEAGADPEAKPLWKIIADLDAIPVPAADRASVPHDGSINYKHYLYGAPKIDVPEDLP